MPINSHSFYDTAIKDSLACWIEVKSAGSRTAILCSLGRSWEKVGWGFWGPVAGGSRQKPAKCGHFCEPHEGKARQRVA
jgi:hypothetical protein